MSPPTPCQHSSSAQSRPGPAKKLIPKHPFALGRIRSDSFKQTFLKGLINQNNIDQSYNFVSNNDPRNSRQNSIPAHEQLFSSKNINTPTDVGPGSPQSFDASPLPLQPAGNVSPLKVMVFIDGTWLYYSIYGRSFNRDVISQKLGKDWKNGSTPDWSSLPALSCQALLQDPKLKWSSMMSVDGNDSDSKMTSSSRPIEVSRVSVYSSMHRDTPTDSLRYKMFADMVKAGFDVNMMETTGPNEKGVDIQLAVDMLYYATIPDAYDVALLLTGDKDFLPALIRCRQKGKRVGLVSMRTGSISFEVTPNLKDYDTIWLEDYLSQWIRKKTPEEFGTQISSYTLKKVVTNFIAKSGETHVSSRDIGRHLKALSVSGQSLLDGIKNVYGGLYQFLIVSKIYAVTSDSRRSEKGFWVSLYGDKNKFEEHPPNVGKLSGEEKQFLRTHEEWLPDDAKKAYDFTTNRLDPSLRQSTTDSNPLAKNDNLESDSLSIDYKSLTIAELKEMCREKGLKVSAQKKIELVERIEAHLKTENLQQENVINKVSPEEYLKSLMVEYLYASGGQASSRDVGRYLAANKGSRGRGTSALAELKETHGSLKMFIQRIPNFYIAQRPESREFDVYIGKESMMKQSSR